MQFWVLFDLRPESHRWWHPYAVSPIWFFICQSFYHWNWDSLGKYYIFNPPKNSSRGKKSLWGSEERRQRSRVDGQEIWMTAHWFSQDAEKLSGLYWIRSRSPMWCVGGVRKGPIWDLTPAIPLMLPPLTTMHLTTSKLKQIKKKKENIETGEKELCWYDIKCACWRYLPGQIKEMFRSGRSSQPRRQVYLSTP